MSRLRLYRIHSNAIAPHGGGTVDVVTFRLVVVNADGLEIELPLQDFEIQIQHDDWPDPGVDSVPNYVPVRPPGLDLRMRFADAGILEMIDVGADEN
jgi:hypothetical protein